MWSNKKWKTKCKKNWWNSLSDCLKANKNHPNENSITEKGTKRAIKIIYWFRLLENGLIKRPSCLWGVNQEVFSGAKRISWK